MQVCQLVFLHGSGGPGQRAADPRGAAPIRRAVGQILWQRKLTNEL